MFERKGAADQILDCFSDEVEMILASVSDDLSGDVEIRVDDARHMKSISSDSIDMIFTSPPYANRMSYIRELRPYMYWLGYLTSGRQAGELDWKSIGGTWGIATSRLSNWDSTIELPIGEQFSSVLTSIAESGNPNAVLLSKYVHKYFYDMSAHFKEAYRVMRSGGQVAYVVGNSSFYGNLAPSERWYAELMSAAGFEGVTIRTIRKRNSNKKLFEFIVDAVRP
jgi:DNA modification methylase